MKLKRNLRLILILFVSTGVGITLVLASWLYGSYHQRMELFLATAERTMFDAIQETVQTQEPLRTPRPPFSQHLIAEIARAYPEIHVDSLAALFDRFRGQPGPPMLGPDLRFVSEKPPVNRPGQLLPHFLFERTAFGRQSMAAIARSFSQGLQAQGINTDFVIDVLTIGPRNEHLHPDSARSTMSLQRHRLDSATASGLAIRPILIDPEQGRFITASFHHPWQYILYSLSWQLIISVVLVVTLIGCFFYLFHTIFKQNELALLRRAFINNITHELRTPVATVSAAVQALQSYTASEDVARRDKYLAISKEELDHLATMIDNVLQVAEGDQLTIKRLNVQEIDLVQIVQRCVEKAYIHHRQKQVAFFFEPATTAVSIRADGEHLRNVVSNLLDNAAKYGATEVRVALLAEAKSKHIELQVHDNGAGIPMAYQDRIFEPFFRVPEGDLHGVKGNGLGLSYVKQVIVQHQGTIRVKSRPGEGSLFTLTIPKNGVHD